MAEPRGWVAQRRPEFCAPGDTFNVGVHRFYSDVHCACGAHRWSEWMARVASYGAEATAS